MPPKAVTKFLLTEKTHVSLKKGMCCDAAHRTDWSNRYTCTAQKGILLFEDASFSIVHATIPIATPFLTLKPMEASREILQNHLATTDTHTARPRGVGEGRQVETQQTGEGAKEGSEEKEKGTGVENLASTSKKLLSKLRGEEEEQHHKTPQQHAPKQRRGEGIFGHSFPFTRPFTTPSVAAYSARSADSEPEIIPVSGGMADTLCQDGGNPGLESELGDGEGWVVLKKGDGSEELDDETEGEGGDGEEEGYVDLAGK
ncbi:hypothetical protein KC330_g5374 [Hortaea werneckii]|nr:hypothetical protein KC330_g5374 [Hortaea werneckii]